MSDQPGRDAAADALQSINRTWLEGRPQDMAPFLHPDIVMVLPGFAGRIAGKEAFVAGFVEFVNSTVLNEYGESDLQIDASEGTALTSYSFEMVYERQGVRYQSKGRDLWVFTRHDGDWLAVWRTMLDVTERPV
jgi:hypothetical protein